MTIQSTQRLLESGTVSSRELVERALEVVATRNDELHAFVEILEVDALESAARLDRERAAGRLRGSLHGIPISVKDLFAVQGATTRAGSLAFERRDAHDAAVVRRLREAGAIILGKTATHEFAMGIIGPQSRNPHDTTRIAGGSSSGAAIAVATGMGAAGVGTDSRGSVRVPAALCGVVGLKPTIGWIALDGVVPLSWTLDHVGVLAGTVADAELIYLALARHDSVDDAAVQQIADMRLGLPRAAWLGVEPEVEASIGLALETLRAAGAEVIDIDSPTAADFDCANELSKLISRSEALAYHRELDLDRGRYTAEVRQQLEDSEETTAQAYLAAQRQRTEMAGRIAGELEGIDALLMPTTPIVAPLVDVAAERSLELTRNVAIWNFVGFPAISVPTAPTAQGLPIGMQVVGEPGREAAILAVAGAVERTSDVR